MTSADHCAEGFPARAGMVLLGVPRIRRSARFPRPRGDGPEWIPGKPMTGEVSPPARGWSLAGFPARAGMVPWSEYQAVPGTGFPRPRGDGPYGDRPRPEFGQVSPPARGWSQYGYIKANALDGFPARAGMVPTVTPMPGAARGFPRPRGDGPDEHRRWQNTVRVSPPARGWSHA